jgi:hypothetical protein
MSHVVFVPKLNGRCGPIVCLVIYIVYKRLHDMCTQADPHPLLTVERMHAAMGGCQLWSNMDFVSGYWQVENHPGDCQRCGRTMPHGNFECCRVVMGMRSAPSMFKWLMDRMLAGVEGVTTHNDDTFTFTAGLGPA